VLTSRSDISFLFVGAGSERRHIDVLAADPRYRERIVIAGRVPYDEVPGYLAACDILAAPHAAAPGFIGSPVKLFEYLAMGKAIVTTDLEQLGEVVQNEHNGLTVPPGDAEALARAIVRLADDEDLRLRLGAAARHDAETLYTWRGNAERVLTRVMAVAAATQNRDMRI